MKKIFTCLFFFLVVAVGFAQWQPDVRLTTDPSSTNLSNNNAWCIATQGSNVYVVFGDSRDSNWEIYYKKSADNGLTWSPDVRLTYSVGSSEYPAIAVSGQTIHVVWMDERDETYNPQIYYKRSTDGGQTWGDDQRLTFSLTGAGLPSLTVAGNDVFVVWHDHRDGNFEVYFKHSPDNGVTWLADTRLTNNPGYSFKPSIAVSGSLPDVIVFVVWEDDWDGNKEIYLKPSSDGGITWQPEIRLTNNVEESQAACIAAQNSTVHVVWMDVRDGNDEIYYKKSPDNGVSWQDEIRLTNSSGVSGNPSIAVSLPMVHLGWMDNRDNNTEIYYKRSTDEGLSWEPDVRLTVNPANSENASLAVFGNFVHVLWQDDRDGNDDAYYKQDPTGNLSVGIGDNPAPSAKLIEYLQNQPNPFQSQTIISWQQAVGSRVILKVFDFMGREIRTLVDENHYPGEHQVTFNAARLTAGIYFYQLRIGDAVETKKMVVVR